MPDIASHDDVLAAALKYAAAGLYVLPIEAGTKKPAAELGKHWQTQSSTDPEQLAAWFAGSAYGVGLHVGRSGVVAFDVDYPDRLPEVLRKAIEECSPPHQATRTEEAGRGHYLFRFRAGRVLGNGVGRLGGGWGEIRGRGGQVVAAPTPHANAAEGGWYAWARTGQIPELPAYVDELLHDANGAGAGEVDVATDAEVQAFLDAHTGSLRADLLEVWVSVFWAKVEAGESRHQRMISVAAGAFAEARAGYFPARLAMDRLEEAFLAAVAREPASGGKQRRARSGAVALSEWRGISAWAVAQANAADLSQVHARVETEVPDGDDLSWIPDEQPAQHPAQADVQGTLRLIEETPFEQSRSTLARLVGRTEPGGGLATSPQMFFDRQYGVLAMRLAKAVLASGPIATDATRELYWYDGGVWRPGGDEQVRHRVSRLLRNRRRLAHAANVVDMLRCRPPVFDDIGADTRYLNVPNGLLDWRTGQLQGHDAAVASAIRIPIPWRPNAACPAIRAWLGEVFPADALGFVEEVIGYCLFNGNPLHKALLLYGRGRNGKGTFLRLLKALLGAGNVSSVTPQALDENRFRAAEMHGKLANLVGDVDPRVFKVTETFKQVTGGDMITAERKYGQPFRYTCRAVMVAAFNKLPRTTDTSEGFFSRWIVVPFTGHFPPGVANPAREAALHEERELQGLLVLAVKGLRRLLDRGYFELPASVEEATSEFRRAADQVRGFLDEWLPTLVTEWVPRTEIYRSYEQWATACGHHSMTAASFYERLEAAGTDNPTHVITPRIRQGTRGYKFLARPAKVQSGATHPPLQRPYRGESKQSAPTCTPGPAGTGQPASQPCARCLTDTEAAILAETGGFCWTCWPGGAA